MEEAVEVPDPLDEFLANAPDEFFESKSDEPPLGEPPGAVPPAAAAPIVTPQTPAPPPRVSNFVSPNFYKRKREDDEEDLRRIISKGADSGTPNVRVHLDEKQAEAVLLALEGKNLFITGKAGTGKSVVVREIDSSITSSCVYVAKISHNGVAAANIGGMTAHSFFGISPDEPMPPYSIPKKAETLSRLKSVKVIIWDEISTAPCRMIDGVNLLMRQIRKSELPFGGAQFIACGDFHQLKPIDDTRKKRDVKQLTERYGGKVVKTWAEAYAKLSEAHKALLHQPSFTSVYAFDAKAWKDIVGVDDERTITLTKIYRQSDDITFLNLLNEVREGRLSESSRLELQKRVVADVGMLPVDYTMLFPRRETVSNVNQARLDKLPDKGHIYRAVDMCISEDYRKLLQHNPLAPEIHLKVGCRVMLKRNLSATLVNGTCGRLIGFTVTPFEDLAKKDGLSRPIEDTVYGAYIPPDKIQQAKYGQPLEGIPLVRLDPSNKTVVTRERFEQLKGSRVDADLATMYNQGTAMGCYRDSGFLPLPVALMDNGEYIVVTPTENKLEITRKRVMTGDEARKAEERDPATKVKLGQTIVEKVVLCSRIQLPLILAYAISVHQSQGLTIKKLCVGLGDDVFEDGMSYVALSRGQSLDTLALSAFSTRAIRADSRVTQFYAGVEEKRKRKLMMEQLAKKPFEEMTDEEKLDWAMANA